MSSALPTSLLNHVLKVTHLRVPPELVTLSLPGQLSPMLDNPFYAENFPSFPSKTPLAHFEAISSCSIT